MAVERPRTPAPRTVIGDFGLFEDDEGMVVVEVLMAAKGLGLALTLAGKQ